MAWRSDTSRFRMDYFDQPCETAWSYLAQVRVTLSQRRLQKHKLTYLHTHFPGMPEASPLFTSSQSMSYSGPPYSCCCSATCFRCKSSTAPTPISSSTDTWSMENKEGQSGKKSHSVVTAYILQPSTVFPPERYVGNRDKGEHGKQRRQLTQAFPCQLNYYKHVLNCVTLWNTADCCVCWQWLSGRHYCLFQKDLR